MAARDKRHGLEFAGIRCLILQNIPDPWQELALIEIKEAREAVKNEKTSSQDKRRTSEAEAPNPDEKIPLYNRVAIAFDELSKADKERISHRGGKREIAKLIARKLPNVKLSSVERELRNVLKDKKLS